MVLIVRQTITDMEVYSIFRRRKKKVLFSKLSISNEFSPHEYILNE